MEKLSQSGDKEEGKKENRNFGFWISKKKKLLHFHDSIICVMRKIIENYCLHYHFRLLSCSAIMDIFLIHSYMEFIYLLYTSHSFEVVS